MHSSDHADPEHLVCVGLDRKGVELIDNKFTYWLR